MGLFTPASYAGFQTSHIKIVTPVNIEELSRLNFGVIQTPEQNSNISINYNGILTGDAEIMDHSAASIAEFIIKGSDFQNVEIKVEYLQNVQFIEFNSIDGSIDGNSGDFLQGMSNVTLTNSGKLLSFGANIRLIQGLNEGNYEPAIRLSVNYE